MTEENTVSEEEQVAANTEGFGVTVDTEPPSTQGAELGVTIANSALEHSVSSYLIGVGEILRQVANAARNLAGDGFDLESFADLIEGKDTV